MKYLCVLFMLYVALLSVRPCCTDDTCTETTTAATATHTDTRTDDDCGACSPFYCCATCAGFTMPAQNIPQVTAVILPQTKLVAYKQPFVQQVITAIWQPPRLG